MNVYVNPLDREAMYIHVAASHCRPEWVSEQGVASHEGMKPCALSLADAYRFEEEDWSVT